MTTTTTTKTTTIVDDILTAKAVAVDVKAVNGISQENRNLGALIEAASTLDVNTGNMSVAEGTFKSTLPEGQTEEMYIAMQRHLSNLVVASTLATGNKAIAAMKENKALDKVEFVLPTVGKDNISVVFERSKQVPDRSPDNTGGTRTQFGSTRVGFNMYGTETRGELKKVKGELQESASAAFAAMAK